MLKLKVLDKTRKDQYQMLPLSFMMLEHGWKQYKNHLVFYKEHDTAFNIHTVMIPKTYKLTNFLDEKINNYQENLMVDYQMIHYENKSPEHTNWYKYYVLPSVWDKLEDCLIHSAIQLYIEGGCYTEAIKVSLENKKNNYCGINRNHYRYYKLTDFNRKYVRLSNKIRDRFWLMSNKHKECRKLWKESLLESGNWFKNFLNNILNNNNDDINI